MEEELRELKELVAQLKADNERLRQECTLALPGPSAAASSFPDAEPVTPHPVVGGASQSERFVFVPRDLDVPSLMVNQVLASTNGLRRHRSVFWHAICPSLTRHSFYSTT
ncbi:hypothetical protein QQF64_024232 [Cirrhinus molitorella]|uniref:Uncharacterized protein n=1 Tax=Cirrhinus molitorella TaxID=172907 RepID=A0ABR3NKP0_9TELE